MQKTVKSAISFLLAIGMMIATVISTIPNQAQAKTKEPTYIIATKKEKAFYKKEKVSGKNVVGYTPKNKIFTRAEYIGKKNKYKWYKVKIGNNTYYITNSDTRKLKKLKKVELYKKTKKGIKETGSTLSGGYYYYTKKNYENGKYRGIKWFSDKNDTSPSKELIVKS